MLRNSLLAFFLISVSAFAASQCDKPKKHIKQTYNVYTATYKNQCADKAYKLYCPKGAQKCTIDIYGDDEDEPYYITSYAIDYSECKKKRLFEQNKFAKFCKKNFSGKTQTVDTEE